MDKLSFVNPIEGDCLNQRDGEMINGKLCIRVTLRATEGHRILLNGVVAEEKGGGCYLGVVETVAGENRLIATDEQSGETCEILVYVLSQATKKYRLSSDDNILFLRDLTEHPESYPSAFDHPYLRVYKQAHELYGAKVQLNLFYETDREALSNFTPSGKYFNLSMMTDRYREEFLSNADWLSFSFHALSEYPNKPYRYAEGELIQAHCKRIHREIERFAGAECISDSVTVHWGEASEACIRSLRDMGYRSFMGYFEYNKKGEPLVAYNATREMIDHIGERDFWYDRQEQILYGRIDLVLNTRSARENHALLKEIVAHPGRGGFVSIMIHEQYFYQSYKRYLADFEESVLESCRYLAEHGYCGAQIADVSERIGKHD